jgi:hypothetical protein
MVLSGLGHLARSLDSLADQLLQELDVAAAGMLRLDGAFSCPPARAGRPDPPACPPPGEPPATA